jgi:uncharacterized protein (DUF1501 family)
MNELISRRNLMKSGGVIAVGLLTPRWLSTIAHADLVRKAKGGGAAKDTVLVVCQLSGGNDGLNTVIPYADKLYYAARPTLGLPEDKVLKLNEHLALHPALEGLHRLYQEQKVAIVQNVGYPMPNRSHFKSMEIWQSAHLDASKDGWIGRYLDWMGKRQKLDPVVALGLSGEQPLAIRGSAFSVPCFASLADVQNMVGDPDAERLLRQVQGADAMMGSNARVVQEANRAALDTVSILNAKLKTFTPKGAYANDPFGQGFKQIAQLLATSPATRVVYFSAGGFDTHARQAEQHEKLLKGFGDAILAFQKEMEAIGKADKVVTLVFSEFGRRVYQNDSQGTDHGAAAPMFLIGGQVRAGVHGSNPDLANLVDGDLKFETDFRQVYAATLDQWMGGDSEVVLGQKYAPAPVFK